MMEPLDLFCCMLESLNLIAAITDGIAWSRSGPNRAARRDARRRGESPPAMELWTIAVVIVTPLLVLLVILRALKWSRAFR